MKCSIFVLGSLWLFQLQSTLVGQISDIPRVQTGTLLVENYAPDRFMLTTLHDTLTILEDEVSFWPTPSVSAAGDIVASARRVSGDASFGPNLVAATYSVIKNKWTDYPTFKGVKAIAISPDGSELACITRDKEVNALDSPRFRFRILNLETGSIKAIQDSAHSPMHPSWSPDGSRLAFDMSLPNLPYTSMRAIYIADLQKGTISMIGLGVSPSWSPSGEWIAYVGYVDDGLYLGSDSIASFVYAGHQYSPTNYQVRVMSTIGTNSRLLMRSVNQDALQPVWSPDSKILLINTVRDRDKGTGDIKMIDFATGKLRTRWKNVAPVYGWVNAPERVEK